MSVRLDALAATLDAALVEPDSGSPTFGAGRPVGEIVLTSASHDSRAVVAGCLYCCVPGATFDGHDFAAAAKAAGAAALLVEHPVEVALPQLVVPSVRRSMGQAASLILGEPSKQLTVLGVTGTNGKTTTVHLLGGILGRDGSQVETQGTLTGARTTPEGPELQARLASAVERGVRYVAMEVSSHALDLHRVDGTRFRVAIFTNLGHDHLDYHADVESYYQAKARLFDAAFTELAVVNIDDPAGRRLADAIDAAGEVALVRIGLADAVNLRISGAVSNFEWRGLPVALHLAGRYNVLNAIGAATAAEALGLDPVDIADALCAVDPPRGRFEFVDLGQPFRVAVDYAHTPDALTAVLQAGREIIGSSGGQVLLVFGCGGDRDRAKRGPMGLAAVEGADVVVVTSDNPRSEDAGEIIAQVLAGIPACSDSVRVEPDRARAIELVVARAEPGDVVVIAGKGHEVEQVIGNVAVPFDDREVALGSIRRWLDARMNTGVNGATG